MKQIIQSYRNGKIELSEVPFPACPAGMVLVRNTHSVVSIGTERSMIELGRKSLLGKAKSRPDLVKRFIEKTRNEGLMKTFNAAMRRLNDAMPLGYSSTGKVAEVGPGIDGYSPGDLVACIGGGFASHSEYIVVPENLCAKVPENVAADEAAFGMLGIIAMHALRCANLQPGERVAVVGLGLLGLILAQLLLAYGFQVIATDLDERKRELARELGVSYVPKAGNEFKHTCEQVTGGVGVDAVILAVATKSDQPIHDAICISRFRGRIVLMGVVDTHPHRNDLWEKEVSLVVSKAGGPGIGDPDYEIRGNDYPIEYVRWTEKRNLEEFLRLLSQRKVKIKPLITHKFDFENAVEVYDKLLENSITPQPIGMLFQYKNDCKQEKIIHLKSTVSIGQKKSDVIRMGVIGGGMFAKTTMFPVLSRIPDLNLEILCTTRGLTGNHLGKQYGFEACTTDSSSILNGNGINAVMVLTQHKDHAKFIIEAFKQQKHLFVEKPLCACHDELKDIMAQYQDLAERPAFLVGYNRRFSSLGGKLKTFFKDRHNPMILNYRVNAGYLAPDHWIFSPENGSGRIIGEACHMVDFLMFLTGARPLSVNAERATGGKDKFINNDNAIITIRFSDGSIGTVVYTGSGDRALERERLEVFCDGKSAVLIDFKILELYSGGKRKRIKLSNQDMGYKAELQHFADIVKGRAKPQLTPEEIFYSTRVVLSAHDSFGTGQNQEITL